MAIKGQKFRKYSYETKLKVVEKYLSGVGSEELMEEYDIRNNSQIETWTFKYRREGKLGLKPKLRGRPKKSDEQTEIEQLRMENEVLKKIQDLLEQEKP
jgi:transposase-like protein